MNTQRVMWALGRRYMGWPALVATRAAIYGRDRVPPTGGAVYAINHLHWIDVPLAGAVSPRMVHFVAKAEAANHRFLGWFLRAHGTIAVRRGEGDRDAVRMMRAAAREGGIVGLFVEGTRQQERPGAAQPGAAMVALQEDVPVIPIAVYGTQFWRIGHFSRCSIAFGEPLRFEGLPRGGRGYKEATVEIERRINVLFDWLAEQAAHGYPKDAVPPV